MQRISLAPVLSATFSRDSCWIILVASSSGWPSLRLADDFHDPPALGRRTGPGLGQPDEVARAGGVLLVVGLAPGRPPGRLLVQAGLVFGRRVLLGHWRSLSSARARWCITVRTLAMSLRTSRSRCGLSSWPVTFWDS